MLLALALLATAAAQDMVRIEGGWATFGTSFADEDVPKEFAPKDEEGAQLEGLKESLESSLGKSMELSVEVDPNLIGGIKLRVGNKFMDASIQNQLESMRQSLLKA